MAHILTEENASALRAADAGKDSNELALRLNREDAARDMGGLAGSSLDPQAQRGRTMQPWQLEQILAATCPSLIFKVHPQKDWIKGAYRQLPGSPEATYLFAFENRPMPEYDVRYAIRKWIPDPDCKRLERGDLRGDKPVTLEQARDLLKKHGKEGAVAELMKRQNNADRVGYIPVVELGGTAIRGWRSVLARAVELKLMTVTDAENVAFKFGTGDRAAWAAHLGKQSLLVQG